MDANTFAILVLLGSFFLMIFLRFPIAYAVALSSVFCLVAQGHNLTTICQQMVKGISSFSLMAVPFFITMGCLMGSGGISEKLIALANASSTIRLQETVLFQYKIDAQKMLQPQKAAKELPR